MTATEAVRDRTDALEVSLDLSQLPPQVLTNDRARDSIAEAEHLLEDRGFGVVSDPDDSPYSPELHALIMLPIDAPDEPDEDAWEDLWDELRDCFGEKEPNPAYEMFRG